MTIDGNIKVFDLSKALFKNGASVTATSGNDTADNMIDFNSLTRWQSVGSDDTTTETLVFTLDEPTTISRLLFLNHNWLEYTITPITSSFLLDDLAAILLDDSSDELEDDGSILEFLNVISLLSSIPISGISETAYSLSSSYYEFDAVYCSGFTVNVVKAQELHDSPDQEKFCFRAIPTIEVNSNSGTFEKFPVLNGVTDFNGIVTRILNSRSKVQKQTSVFVAGLNLRTNVQNDIELLEFMRYTNDDFLFWPNGGKLTESFFRFNSTPYKLTDIFQMQVNNNVLTQYFGNIYSNIIDSSVGIIETI